MISAPYAALAGLFLVYLSMRVIALRRSERVSVGAKDSPTLERAMRVQANFVEYTPIALLLLILAEMQGLAPWAVHACGALILGARVAHFLGFRSREAPGVLRVVGMLATFTVIGLLALILLAQSFVRLTG